MHLLIAFVYLSSLAFQILVHWLCIVDYDGMTIKNVDEEKI